MGMPMAPTQQLPFPALWAHVEVEWVAGQRRWQDAVENATDSLVLVGMQGTVDHMATALEQVIKTLGRLVVQQASAVAAAPAAASMAHGPCVLMTIPMGNAGALPTTHFSHPYPCPGASVTLGIPQRVLSVPSSGMTTYVAQWPWGLCLLKGSLLVGRHTCLLLGLTACSASCCPCFLWGWRPMGFPMALPPAGHP